MTTIVYGSMVNNLTRLPISGRFKGDFAVVWHRVRVSEFYIKSSFVGGEFFDNLRKKEFFSKKVCTNSNFCAKIFP